MKQFKAGLLAIWTLMFLAYPVLISSAPTALALDSSKQAACESLGSTSCTDDTGGPSVEGAIRSAIELLSYIAGIVAVIMIIIAGIRLIASQGDPKGLSTARNAIIYAAIGIIIVVMSQIFVRFILGRIT